jgi:hypothetical protein
MRAALVVIVFAIALAVGPSASAKDQGSVFPDLPGVDMLEEATAGKGPDVSSGTSGNAPEPNDRVPAPASAPDSTSITKAAVTDDQLDVVTSLPGGGGLPIIKDVAQAGSDTQSIAPLVLFAALFTLALTRFMYRLNELGRRKA